MFLLIDMKAPRTIWMRPRTEQWWMDVQSGKYGNGWWKDNLRMTEHTFRCLCNELRPFIQKKTTLLRMPVSVEKRVAVTIWKLSTNVEYRTLSNLFGIGLSTASVIVAETCDAISSNLLKRYVKIPEGDNLKEVVRGFESYWGFPQTAGAIDGSHIPIIRPEECASDYYNRKGYYSIILQGLVDFRGHFMDVCIGWPGKVHDARVFANSALYKKAIDGKLFPSWSRKLGTNSIDVPLVVLGDPAYPLLTWLMKPYIENASTTAKEKRFNYRQSRARMVVENAFGRLKGRWRCLLKRLDCNLKNIPDIVASCVVLHNFCEIYGDNFQEQWASEDSSQDINHIMCDSNTSTRSPQAAVIRAAITDYLS